MAAPNMADLEEEARLHPYPDASIRPEGFQADPLHPVADSTIRPGITIPPPAPAGQPPVMPGPVQAPGGPAPVAAPSGRPILDTTSTTSEKLSKVQQEDFTQLDKIRTDEQAATKQLTADKVKDAGLEQKAADDMAQAQLDAQAQKAAAIQQAQERRAQAEGAYQQKLEAFNGKEFHSFWSGRPAAAEILADIGVALGAFGASGRGQNEALQILNGRVQQDFDLQKAQIEKAKDSVVMAKTGIADADQARQVAMEDLDIKRNAAMEAIKARLVAGKSAQLGDRAQAEGNMDVAKIAKDIQERKERTTAGMATRTTSSYVNPAALEAKADARAEARAAASGKSPLDVVEREIRAQLIGSPRSPGPGTQLTKIQGAKESLQDALKSGDPGALRAATDAFKEAVGPMLSGGRTTQFLGQTISDEKTLRDKMDEALGKIKGNPAAGKTFAQSLTRLADVAEGENQKQVDEIRRQYMQRTMGAGGIAKTPELKEQAQGLHDTFFGGIRGANGPRYGNTQGAAAQPPPPPITAELKGRLNAVLASSKTSADEKQKARFLLGQAQ